MTFRHKIAQKNNVAATWVQQTTFLLFFFVLQSLVLKPIIDCFSLKQESIWRFWLFPWFLSLKSYPQPRSNAVYKSTYGKSKFQGLYESYNIKTARHYLILAHKREKTYSLKEVITTYWQRKQVSEKCRIHCLDAACSLSWNLAAYVSYFPQESTSMTAVVEVTVAILRSKAACFVRKWPTTVLLQYLIYQSLL